MYETVGVSSKRINSYFINFLEVLSCQLTQKRYRSGK